MDPETNWSCLNPRVRRARRRALPQAQAVPAPGRDRQEVEQDGQVDGSPPNRAASGSDDPDYRLPRGVSQVVNNSAVRTTRAMSMKRRRDESENDSEQTHMRAPVTKHRDMRTDRRIVTAKRHRGENDAELPTPKRFLPDSQASVSRGAIDAPQPLRRSARLSDRQHDRLLRYLPHGDKHELEEPEPGPSEKRMRVLPAEQELMQMDAVSLARKMCS